MRNIIGDLKGKRFGKWTVLQESEEKYKWVCRCDCGTIRNVVGSTLTRGVSTNCGCVRHEKLIQRNMVHGKSTIKLYNVWENMKARCNNPNRPDYKYYGARGITVCKQWSNANGFNNFYQWAMKNGYDEKADFGHCTLDRIDSYKNYEPSNCRWITIQEQQRNKRNNRPVTINGETHIVAEWEEITGVSSRLIIERLNNGFSPKEAIQHGRRKKRCNLQISMT